MAINELIARGGVPLQIEQPMNQLARMMQMQQAQQGIDKGRAELDEYGRKIERNNNLLKLVGGLGSDATDEQRSTALKGGGYFTEADALDKNVLERSKLKSESQFKQAESLARFAGVQKDLSTRVFSNPTLENATAALTQAANYHKMLGFGDMDIEGELLQLRGMTSPDQIKQWAAGHSMSAEKLLPTINNFAAGDRHVTQSVDPVTGQTREVGSTVIGQSADNKATNARSAAEGAANRGQSMTIAKMADSRARDLNAITQAGNENKPLNDSQSKAALFGSRMKNADSILGELADSGVTTSYPGANAGWGIGSVVGSLQPGKQQQLDQAKRDFVNAVLRRESGASISPSEFDSAEKQYFPSINDSAATKAQKANARAIAIRGMLEEVPANQREKVVSNIIGKSGASSPKGAGGFKYLGTE